jgi:hypothetical protein
MFLDLEIIRRLCFSKKQPNNLSLDDDTATIFDHHKAPSVYSPGSLSVHKHLECSMKNSTHTMTYKIDRCMIEAEHL